MTTTAPRIHHATAKKAAANSITLTIEGDRFVAIDNDHNPDNEYSDSDAARLLAHVLGLRPAAPKKTHMVKADEDEADEDEADEDEADEDEADDEEGGTVVKEKYKKVYAEFDDTNGDAFADALSVAGRTSEGTLDLDACARIAADNGLEAKWAEWSAKLNPGQRRMCLGNVLRGMVRKTGTVVIGRQVFEGVRDENGDVVVKTSKPRGAVR